MDQNIVLSLVAVAAVFIGFAIGAIVGKRSGAGFQRVKQLEEQLSTTTLELEGYKADVKRHFGETADAFKTLNESYADLHSKLSSGAHLLLDEPVGPLLEAKANPEQASSEATDDSKAPVEPPLDYAPRKSPDEKGALAEDYGLAKNQPANDAA